MSAALKETDPVRQIQRRLVFVRRNGVCASPSICSCSEFSAADRVFPSAQQLVLVVRAGFLSSSLTFSIGESSDESCRGGGAGNEKEVQSEYKGGPLDCLYSLEEEVPVKCGKANQSITVANQSLSRVYLMLHTALLLKLSLSQKMNTPETTRTCGLVTTFLMANITYLENYHLQAFPITMDGLVDKVTTEEVRIFYRIDRELYTVLVRNLSRNPVECIHVMGLWLFLERLGIGDVISSILGLTPLMINRLADEAVTCLKLIANVPQSSAEASGEIPLTRRLVQRNVSLQYFHKHQRVVLREVQSLIADVYIPALSDIIEWANQGGFCESSSRCIPSPAPAPAPVPGPIPVLTPGPVPVPTPVPRPIPVPLPVPGPVPVTAPVTVPVHQYQPRALPTIEDSLALSFSGLNIMGHALSSTPRTQARPNPNDTSEHGRTMFATFSKGYPVTEGEVRRFFTRLFGNCIESLYMQDVRPDQQPLYARIVFYDPSILDVILNGEQKAKFTINGKHVWMRRFVHRNECILPCGCPSPSTGSNVCPLHQH